LPQAQATAPKRFDARTSEPAGIRPSNGHRDEPLLHWVLRKIKTSDRCFSAMAFAFKALQRLGISLGLTIED